MDREGELFGGAYARDRRVARLQLRGNLEEGPKRPLTGGMLPPIWARSKASTDQRRTLSKAPLAEWVLKGVDQRKLVGEGFPHIWDKGEKSQSAQEKGRKRRRLVSKKVKKEKVSSKDEFRDPAL